MGEKTKPTPGERVFALYRGLSNSTYGPTATHRKTLQIVQEQLNALDNQLQQAKREMEQLAQAIVEAGGPMVAE